MRGFYEIAAADAGRPALLGSDGSTYGELLSLANQASNGLIARGVGPGDSVVTVLRNGLDALTMMLATHQIGAYLVPVNWHFTDEEIAYIVADSGAKAVISPAALTVGALAAGQPDTAPERRRAGSMMLYTSGTTGRPKGVRRRLLDLTPEELYPILMRKSWTHFGLPAGGVHLVCSQLYHSAPYGQAMMALQLGHSIVAPERFDAAQTLRLVERHRVTNAFMVPTMFHRLLAVPDREKYDLSSLTHLFHGAAPCPPATKQAMIDWLGPVLWEYYGSTEAAVATMVSSEEWLARPGTVGRALDGMTFTIVGDGGEEVAPGEPGLVYIGGVNRFEYHGDPGKTAAASSSAQMPAQSLELAYERVIKQVLPSIVQITTKAGLGSGIVYDSAGHIITNAHVVGQATQMNVTLATGSKSRTANLVKSFTGGDLAVIKVDDPKGLTPAKFGDSSKLRVGQVVLAMGNPLGLSGSVTDGIISALGRTVSEPQDPGSPGATITGAIQTSASINPGNSGGALVDLNGQVIGIPTLAATDPDLGGGAAPGIGFAIPSNTATDIAAQIVRYGKVTNSHRAALGIRGSTVIGDDGQPTGVAVAKVDKGSAAQKAGIKPGDVIISVNGQETLTMAALAEVVSALKPGQQAKVEVVRLDGSTKTITVTLGVLPGD